MKLRTEKLEKILIACALSTGFIHVHAGLSSSFQLLTLAGLGFLAGALIFYFNYYRNLVVISSIPYTGSQFVFYYRYFGLELGPIVAIDKIIQLGFMVAGVYLLYIQWKITESPKEFLLS